jgi:hypothetical protein
VVEHVCVWHEAISLYSIYCNTKYSTGNHHSYFRVLLYGELGKIWNFSANQIIISFNVLNFLVNLVQKWTSGKHIFLVLIEENWEVSQTFWKDVKVLGELWRIFFPLLEQIGSQESVLWRN